MNATNATSPLSTTNTGATDTASTNTSQPVLALFPLNIFLLPGGISQLRIFEQRYIRMVKQAVSGEGFVLCLHKKDRPFNVPKWGAKVTITDFEQKKDGLLYITIFAEKLVKIDNVYMEDDGLRMAAIASLNHWRRQAHNAQTLALADKLQAVFISHPQLQRLYSETHFDNPNWVCKRWLEILPIEISTKQNFVSPTSFDSTVQMLDKIIIG
ncbi:hypothetical protein C2869_12700 [Saccharobesus litoralis]|uniref:Lon N-terminal domain-containing protein n=1 Tax=Saccharobesus litoralis TaxID=2172099 RepID=A0A2S0VSQ5_9ALTE|nr:LON peptidase substrate-binding domain-containing protein [Saccharobesus litoralis]AWB67245.1 hypothetical protein C2869_12700 [Saccharobesus litoralis]